MQCRLGEQHLAIGFDLPEAVFNVSTAHEEKLKAQCFNDQIIELHFNDVHAASGLLAILLQLATCGI